MKFESKSLGTDVNTSGIGDTCPAVHLITPYFLKIDKMKYAMNWGLYVTMPTGDYDKEKSVNIGENRWAIEPEYTPVIWHFGPAIFELTGSVKFYGDNDEYTKEELTLEKDPRYLLQSHLSYDITEKLCAGISYFIAKGGETELNGESRDDETDKQALKLSAAFNLTSETEFMVQYQADLKNENGIKQNYIGTRFTYFW